MDQQHHITLVTLPVIPTEGLHELPPITREKTDHYNDMREFCAEKHDNAQESEIQQLRSEMLETGLATVNAYTNPAAASFPTTQPRPKIHISRTIPLNISADDQSTVIVPEGLVSADIPQPAVARDDINAVTPIPQRNLQSEI